MVSVLALCFFTELGLHNQVLAQDPNAILVLVLILVGLCYEIYRGWAWATARCPLPPN